LDFHCGILFHKGREADDDYSKSFNLPGYF